MNTTDIAGRPVTVTMTDVADLAGVKRPTVSNWRRRHENFPEPVGGSEMVPEFDAERVAEWLDARVWPERKTDDDGNPVGPQTYGVVFRSNLRLRGLAGGRGDDESIRSAIALTALRVKLGRPLIADDAPEAGAAALRTVNELVALRGGAGAVERLIETADRGTSTIWASATPPAVAELIGGLVGDVTSRSLCDPAAGVGDLLARVLAGRTPTRLWAFDLDAAALMTLRHRLTCHGVDADIRQVDSLSDWPAADADVVIVDPPFISGDEQDRGDGPSRWVDRAVAHLGPSGRAFVVVPAWWLSRRSLALDEARRLLLARKCVAAIVQLPRRVHAFRTGTELALLVLTAPGKAGDEIVLCNADKVAQRRGPAWPAQAAAAVRERGTGARDECHVASIADLARASSWLPAHRLAPMRPSVDHLKRAIDAQRALHEVCGSEQWARCLDVPEARPDAGQRRLTDVAEIIGGHRIKVVDIEERVPETGRTRVIGAEELRGQRSVGSRSIDTAVGLGAYPTTMTNRGDVIVLVEGDVRAIVDDRGDSIVLFPAQIVRPYPEGVPSRVLARILAAPRNAGRQSGSLVRRASLRSMVVPDLPAAELVRMEAYLAELDARRAELTAKLGALNELDRAVSAGVADGVVRVAPAPGHQRAMMKRPASEPRRKE